MTPLTRAACGVAARGQLNVRQQFRTCQLLAHGQPQRCLPKRIRATRRFASGPHNDLLEVVVIGCGLPEKSMGWYHAQQFLNEFDKDCLVTGIVEPWYLGDGKAAPNVDIFRTFQDRCNQKVSSSPCEMEWTQSVEQLAPRPSIPSSAALAIIACRTPDMPQMVCQALSKGFTHVYLEKPGASSVQDLAAILREAEAREVPVVMGYNKNASAYVSDAVAQVAQWQSQGTQLDFSVSLEHNNAFDLPSKSSNLVNFASGPGCEGIVHNMCCHELALAHTFFGLSVDTLHHVDLLPGCIELPLGERNDFQRLAFRCYLNSGTQIDFIADRCGGNHSSVHLNKPDCPPIRFTMPDSAHAKWIMEQQQLLPNRAPYFLLQEPDYRELKRRIIAHIRSGHKGVPLGLVDLKGAREVLALADFLAPKLYGLIQ